jgi:glycosyltransferase involved in cell wall biosynthesis
MNRSKHLISVVIPIFQDGERAVVAARAMLMQSLPPGLNIEVIAVDDGSGDDTLKILAQCKDERLLVIQLDSNHGRSTARNVGAQRARGEMIVFMDCDCIPADDSFLAEHHKTLQSGCVASTGHVTGIDDDFWSRYQRDASQRRQYQHAKGAVCAGSSQNMAVRGSAFEGVGGFDTAFRHYGFEDRDLLLRLADVGNIAWAADAVVYHLDSLTLPEVSRKMMQAGGSSARAFARRHPVAYRTLGYAGIDARLHPWLRPVGTMSGPFALRLAPHIDPMLKRLPFPLAKILVKSTCALAFLYGTTRDH